MEKQHLVVMALGPDRVGLVAQLTRFIRECGGNVEDSRMVSLGCEFGVMVLVSGSEEQLATLERSTSKLTDEGLQVLVRRTRVPCDRGTEREQVIVAAEALHHEGIVHAVAAAIERLGVNIASLETGAYPAPLSGGPLFRLEAVLDLPSALDADGVRKGLADVAEAENLHIEVRTITRST